VKQKPQHLKLFSKRKNRLLFFFNSRTVCNAVIPPASGERTEGLNPTDLSGSGWTGHSNPKATWKLYGQKKRTSSNLQSLKKKKNKSTK